VGKGAPLFRLLRRYHPGPVLLVGAAMGVGIGLPSTFLRTYAADLGFSRIGLFFSVYAPAAILTRIGTRRLPERLGIRPMILIGLGILAAGQLLLVAVRSQWMLVVPGVVYGIAHAILFPSAVAAGATAFPERYRGLGTTLMLATFDFGMLIGAPTAGLIVHFAGAIGLPSYPTMFVSMAAMLLAVNATYAVVGRRTETAASQVGQVQAKSETHAEPAVAGGETQN
jgi:MFS family permease